MAKSISRNGEKFGRLTIIREKKYKNSKHLTVVCVCECGNIKEIRKSHVISGETLSCGCFASERARETINKIRETRIISPEARIRMGGKTQFKKTHGMKGTKTYSVWSSMKARCYTKSCGSYKSYGARGIRVCDAWISFEGFFKDMGEATEGKSIDRIDNNGNYSKDNCRWADAKTQQRNKRTNIFLTIDGVSKTIAEWSELTGIKRDTISKRLQYGWDHKKAVMKEVRK